MERHVAESLALNQKTRNFKEIRMRFAVCILLCSLALARSVAGKDYVLTSGEHKVVVTRNEKGLRISKWTVDGGTLIDSASGALWKFKWLVKPKGFSLPSRMDVTTKTNEKGVACLNGEIEYPDGLSLTVEIRLSASDGCLRFRSSLAHSGTNGQLDSFSFPLLNGIRVDSPEHAGVAVPRIHGRYFKKVADFTSGYRAEYPFGYANMQIVGFTGRETGICVVAEDPEAVRKRFSVSPAKKMDSYRYELTHLPTYDVAYKKGGGERFHTNYDVVLKVTNGSWLAAAKIYRKWALRQFWASKGPVSERTDIPEYFKKITYWHYSGCWEGSHFDEFIPATLAFQKKLARPAMYWWAGWHSIKFDDSYPEYLPPKKGFGEWCDKLRKAGIYPVPYVNTVYWDMTTKSWNCEDGEKYACANRDGKVHFGKFANGHKNAMMCPFTEGWRRKITDICAVLAKEYKVGGVYLDCLGTGPTVPCFNPAHGHPLGYGRYSSDGRRALLREIRKACRKYKPDFIMVCEGNPEDMIADCEGFLAQQQDDDTIPLFEAVYSDRTFLHGEDTRTDYWSTRRILPLAHGLARNLLWGDQIGRGKSFRVTQCANPVVEKFIVGLCDTREKWMKFLRDGEYFGEALSGPQLRHSVVYTGDRSQYTPMIFPVLESAVWLAPDDELAFFVVNCTPESRVAVLRNPSEISLLPIEFKDSSWNVTLFENGALKSRFTLKGNEQKNFSVNVSGYSIIVARFKKARSSVEPPDNKPPEAKCGFEISSVWSSHNFLSAENPEIKLQILNPLKYRGNANVQVAAELHRRGSMLDWTKFVVNWRWSGKIKLSGASMESFVIKGPSKRMPWPRTPAGDAKIIMELQVDGRTVASGTAGLVLGGHKQPVAVALETDAPIVVDGRLGEWKDAEWITVDKRSDVMRRKWRGPRDLSARFAMRWDSKKLYIALMVEDDRHCHTMGKTFQGDSAQFAFFAERNGIPLSQMIHFGLALNDSGGTETFQWSPKRGGKLRGVTAVARRSGRETVYEASIDRDRIFGPDAEALDEYRLSWAALDIDAPNESLGWIEWGGGVCSGYDRKRFGILKLRRKHF